MFDNFSFRGNAVEKLFSSGQSCNITDQIINGKVETSRQWMSSMKMRLEELGKERSVRGVLNSKVMGGMLWCYTLLRHWTGWRTL